MLYSGFYILLEPVAGTVLLPIIMGWTAYGAYEGRAPALLDNLTQALVLAPFFVFMELLFKFGYRPELQKRVNEAADKEIKKFRAEKAAAAAAKNGKAN
jgi:uncharacterized membrane protein YGL010W